MLFSCESWFGSKEEPTKENAPYDLAADIPSYFSQNYEIPADNPLTVEGIALGRMLFYETKLSGDNSQSCASCHKQENGFSDPNRFSEGIDGEDGTKNAMALANLLWQRKFFWDGRASSLEEQALLPIQDPIEMHQSLEASVAKLEAEQQYLDQFELAFGEKGISAEKIGKALAQFERTMISANSKYDQYLRGEYEPTAKELLGIELFFIHPISEIGLRGGNCGDCHLGPMTHGDLNDFQGFHNNGLDEDGNLNIGLKKTTGKEEDLGKFKAPSLRNIALTAPYMHDGRFQTLEEVLDHYNEHVNQSATLDPLIIEASNEKVFPNEPIKLHLAQEEKEAILAFLHMLTDETFITNERFSNPFETTETK
ncbi:cytochrome c peroxidase [Flammeovirgaceae bacterium SG7u.111]|nr:cytochrome c peroxidase [Flammeovirgaceae bacterium SG7u.132]WPO34054.1 cytochrome c peroxidase [Flammeovirgaceae bacterium SG7u.111]